MAGIGVCCIGARMITVRNITEDGQPLFGKYDIHLDGARIGDLEYSSEDGTFHIDSMWIDESHRGLGIAEQSLRLILEERTESQIECHIISMQSLKFFVKVLGLPFHIENRFIENDFNNLPFDEFIEVAKEYLVEFVEIDDNGNFNYKDWFVLKFHKK